MPAVLLVALALWILGHVLGTRYSVRIAAISGLLLAVIAAQLLLPEGHALRELTGGDVTVWLVLGFVSALVGAYVGGLIWARRRARAPLSAKAPPREGSFSAEELARYSRHIMLREIGGPGQKRLRQARVLVIGAGGLGSPALLYLGAAGVGTIGVIDDDIVELPNLQRQIIHTRDRLDMPKVFSAQLALADLNPHVKLRPYKRRLTEEIAADLFCDYDLILDGSDNFETRYLANRAAVATQRPLISGALTAWEGQIAFFDPAHGGPCFQCVFPQAPDPELVPDCATAGVFSALPGIIGAMMAAEAIKHLTGAGTGLRGRLVIHDAQDGRSRVIKTAARPDCPICGGRGEDDNRTKTKGTND